MSAPGEAAPAARLFVATLLDDELQASYTRLVSELVREHRGVLRGVPERTFHITYGFSARTPEEKVPSLAHAIEHAVSRHRALTVSLSSAHVIPPGTRPRLVGVSVHDGEQLGRLADDLVRTIARECPESNIEPSKSLHVTLARFRRPAGRRDARAVADWLETRARVRSGVRIAHVHLVQSTLGGPAPVYTVLREVPIDLSDR